MGYGDMRFRIWGGRDLGTGGQEDVGQGHRGRGDGGNGNAGTWDVGHNGIWGQEIWDVGTGRNGDGGDAGRRHRPSPVLTPNPHHHGCHGGATATTAHGDSGSSVPICRQGPFWASPVSLSHLGGRRRPSAGRPQWGVAASPGTKPGGPHRGGGPPGGGWPPVLGGCCPH